MEGIEIIILMESFLNTPPQCFAFIYDQYTIGDHRGYMVIAMYPSPTDEGLITTNLGGFSQEEIYKYTIPYNNNPSIRGELGNFISMLGANRNDHLIIENQTLFDYFTNERLISYIRDYTISQVI